MCLVSSGNDMYEKCVIEILPDKLEVQAEHVFGSCSVGWQAVANAAGVRRRWAAGGQNPEESVVEPPMAQRVLKFVNITLVNPSRRTYAQSAFNQEMIPLETL